MTILTQNSPVLRGLITPLPPENPPPAAPYKKLDKS